MAEIKFKVVFLGAAETGKTSIVNRYHLNEFTNANPTVGANFVKHSKEFGTTPVTACIWDTAGQERFLSITAVYYRSANAAVIVYDCTNADTFHERLKFWVEQVRANVSACRLYVVANKYDLVADGIADLAVARDEAARFAEAVGARVFYTSAKSGLGVAALFEAVFADYVRENLPELRRGAAPAPADEGVVDIGAAAEKKDRRVCGIL
eukprot:gnl/Chilomastix_cuspidata/1083.p1 GENE.gnl/Chilomastix_cuspidata/1083~~gnl/Chilomastix_cuspidata/1083.p1  ORF type:complete len:209 (-),score=107.45 gnl/Chilomastix_cuspidata/1083:928-1554(-)